MSSGFHFFYLFFQTLILKKADKLPLTVSMHHLKNYPRSWPPLDIAQQPETPTVLGTLSGLLHLRGHKQHDSSHTDQNTFLQAGGSNTSTSSKALSRHPKAVTHLVQLDQPGIILLTGNMTGPRYKAPMFKDLQDNLRKQHFPNI